MRRRSITRFGLILVVICLLMGNGCEMNTDTEVKETAAKTSANENVIEDTSVGEAIEGGAGEESNNLCSNSS